MRNVSAILLDPTSKQPGLHSIELAEPAQGQAIVRLLAAPIHPADLNTVEGKYPGRPVFGREGVGVVEALGPSTEGLAPGTRVLLPSGVSTWCEACVCEVEQLIVVPEALATDQAAVVRVNPASAWRMLHDFVTLKRGEWVLQNAANSAVGRAVIQIAHASGWKTINLVRRAELIEELLRAGGDVVLLDDEHAVERIKELTAGSARLALNAVGGESALRLANALGDSGTLVTYGAMGRQPLRLPNGLLIFKDLRAVGFWLTRWTERATIDESRAMMTELLRLAERGVLRSKIEQRYPLREFAAALEHAKRSGRAGKILLGNSSEPY